MHLVLINRLGSLTRNSVVRLTDRLDMIIVVDRDVKTQIKQTKYSTFATCHWDRLKREAMIWN